MNAALASASRSSTIGRGGYIRVWQPSGVSHHTDPERRLEDGFVASLVSHFVEMASEKAFDKLIVAAGPRALGAFQANAPKSLTELVKRGCTRIMSMTPP